MSDEKQAENLQFEKAEFDSAEGINACASCKSALAKQYFSVNGQSLCADCTDNIRSTLNRKSSAGNTLKSLLYGIGAGAAGFMIYFAVLKITGYEIGLIAILVGYMVGKAVMIGSDYRGGIRYSIIAVLLTYVSIVSTHVPLIIGEMRKQDAQAATAAATGPGADTPTVINAATTKPDPRDKVSAGQRRVTTAEAQREPAPPLQYKPPGPASYAIAFVMFAGYVLMIPFLSGFSNIIGLVIIGFALFEAARRTARPKVTITGPFEISNAEGKVSQDMNNA